MVPNDALINVLRRKLNYKFKRQTERVNVYKERGSTRRALIKKSAWQCVTPEYARSILRSAGMDEEDIEQFLAQVNN